MKSVVVAFCREWQCQSRNRDCRVRGGNNNARCRDDASRERLLNEVVSFDVAGPATDEAAQLRAVVAVEFFKGPSRLG